MTNTFRGHAFGLEFHCQRLLPELWPGGAAGAAGGGDAPIAVEWNTPREAPSVPPQAGLFRATRDAFRLTVPGIATYGVTADAMVIDPEPGADDASVRAFLFGSAVAALLHLRGLAVLHGSAVRLPDGSAAVFCGSSTAGKSTLAAALARRQHPMLADDIAAVSFDACGRAWCLPGLARTKLWRSALNALGLAWQASPAAQLRPHLDKFSVSLASALGPTPLGRLYELRANEQGGLAFSAVNGIDKVNLLMAHTFRQGFLRAMGRQAQQLRHAAALAPQLEMTRIDRPRHEPTLETICQRLEETWRR